MPVETLVLNSNAGNTPFQSSNLVPLKAMRSVALAEKHLYEPGPVQFLLAADVYEDLFRQNGRRIMGYTIATLSSDASLPISILRFCS